MLRASWTLPVFALFLLSVSAARAEDVVPGRYTLQADTGKYLARCNGCVPGGAYADNAGVHESDPTKPWARWSLSKRPSGKWVLQSDTGRFLARCAGCGPGAYPDSAFVHETNPDAPWAQWSLVKLANGRWTLQADTGRLLSRCNACFTGGKVADNAFVHVTDGPWSQWSLTSAEPPPIQVVGGGGTQITPQVTQPITVVGGGGTVITPQVYSVQVPPSPLADALSPPAPTSTFAPTMTPAKAEAMIKRLGSATQGFVNGPTSQEQHAVGNHINGMARVGPYWVVNYTDTGRETGRLLYWDGSPGGSYSVYNVGGVGGGNNYLSGMAGAGDIVAFASTTSTLRFIRIRPGTSPVALTSFSYDDGTKFGKVGLADDVDKRTFVLMTKNGSGAIEIREGGPGRWTLLGTLPDAYATSWGGADEESRPLVYMGNGVFAAFVLKPGDDDFQFSYQVFSLQGTASPRTIVPYGTTSKVTLTHKEPPGSGLDPFKGYASFRWAGTVLFNGRKIEICAAPRELNNAYLGDYTCWRTE